jgi:hypothetical protein
MYRCLVVVALIPHITMATTEEEAVAAAVAHASALASVTKNPTPNPLCIATHCGGAARKCIMDSDCRSALGCTTKCFRKDPKEQNQTCIFQCTSDFENDVYDGMLYCMFNQNDCMGTKKNFNEWQACRALDKVPPMTQYRNKPLTKEVARNILMRGTDKRGDWMVARGKSAAYDCFDCQYLYWGYRPDRTMYYQANYKIHKSDGGVRWNTAVYVASEWEESIGRFSMNASNYGGLEHEEDWRLLAADESADPQWIAMYYCGAAAGVGEAYEGAFILTPTGDLPTDAKSLAAIDAVYKKAGITLQCKTDNSNCTGHPTPPSFRASALIV